MRYRLLFKVGNKWEEADPSNVQWVSNTEFKTKTPNFRKYGHRSVDVYLMIDEDLVSVTKTSFTYFVDTKCEKSCAYGPGLHHEQNAEEETVFIINARDEDNNNRTSGRDDWNVKIWNKETRDEIEYKIVDNDNGTYNVTYQVESPQTVLVDITIVDSQGETKRINGCPYSVEFKPATPETKGLNSLDGQIIINYIKDTTDSIRNFIDEKNAALDIENRNYQEDVHELLDVKKNFTECYNANEYNERELDLL